jgi:hypothetical protein
MKYLPSLILCSLLAIIGAMSSCQPNTDDDNPTPVYGKMSGFIGDTLYWEARDVKAQWSRVDSARTILEITGKSVFLNQTSTIVLRIPNPQVSSFSVGVLDSSWANVEAYFLPSNSGGIIGENGTVGITQLDTALRFLVEGNFDFSFASSVSDTIRIGDDSTGRDSVVTTTQEFEIRRGTFSTRMTRTR